jgi:O-antigen/teichoic acid export membrane protein
MSQIRQNLVANFLGRGWAALMPVAFIPVYIRLMGIESYGLVGFATTLVVVFSIFDLGLSMTLNRELARLSVKQQRAGDARDLVRTLELIYWAVAAIMGLLVIGLAPFLAQHWIRAEHLTVGSVEQAILLMGLMTALQFPFALYSGGLLGLQRQVLLNGLTIAMVTLRSVGAVLILWQISPTIQAFLAWQALVYLLQTALSGAYLWRSLPDAGGRPHFRTELLRDLWRFAAGMTGISVLSAVLLQLDKVVLSKVLTLEQFGYYNIATVIAAGLYSLVVPVFSAVFPRLSQFVAEDRTDRLKQLYHDSSQIMAVVVLPVAAVIAAFAPEVLLIWTGNPEAVRQASVPLSLLVIGTALNGLMNIPYALQLASGWTQMAMYQNLITVLVMVPALLWAAPVYGATGAACIWVAVNAGYVLVGVPLTHRRLLRGEQTHWYTHAVVTPILATLLVVAPARLFFPDEAPRPVQFMSLLLVAGLTFVACAWLTPITNRLARQLLTSRRFSIFRG